MSAVTQFRTHTGVTNARVFSATIGGIDAAVYWNGPGARLQLLWGDGQLARITHPAAAASYADTAAARTAARAFFAAWADDVTVALQPW